MVSYKLCIKNKKKSDSRLFHVVAEKPGHTVNTSPVRDMNAVIGNRGILCTFIFL